VLISDWKVHKPNCKPDNEAERKSRQLKQACCTELLQKVLYHDFVAINAIFAARFGAGAVILGMRSFDDLTTASDAASMQRQVWVSYATLDELAELRVNDPRFADVEVAVRETKVGRLAPAAKSMCVLKRSARVLGCNRSGQHCQSRRSRLCHFFGRQRLSHDGGRATHHFTRRVDSRLRSRRDRFEESRFRVHRSANVASLLRSLQGFQNSGQERREEINTYTHTHASTQAHKHIGSCSFVHFSMVDDAGVSLVGQPRRSKNLLHCSSIVFFLVVKSKNKRK
jgi:hypothetical protein